MPVKVFVIEPIWNSVSGVTASGFSTDVVPKPATCSSPSCSSPTAAPGVSLSARAASTAAQRSSNSAIAATLPLRRRGERRLVLRDASVASLPQSAAATRCPAAPARRARERVRERRRAPVRAHLPPQRAGNRPRDCRARARDERVRLDRERACRRGARRSARRQGSARLGARLPRDRLRGLRARGQRVEGLRRRHRDGNRQRPVLARAVDAHHRADAADAPPRGVRDAAGRDEPRDRARCARRRADRDDLAPRHVRRAVPRQRRDVRRLPRGAHAARARAEHRSVPALGGRRELRAGRARPPVHGRRRAQHAVHLRRDGRLRAAAGLREERGGGHRDDDRGRSSS